MTDASDAVVGEQAAAAVAPTPALARLLFILDITVSMSAELEACKYAIREMVQMLAGGYSAGQLSFAIVTFTESYPDGCFTSCFESTSAEDADAYMDSISLCRPPEEPGILVPANGQENDWAENHKAALARTTQLDASIPTIAFLITDAEPHTGLNFHQSDTAMHELRYLELNYPNLSSADARDFFKCFQQTAFAHFGSNMILNCIVCNSCGRDEDFIEAQLLFASLAQQTGGMLMEPLSRNSSSMANGLLSVVKALMARLDGGQAQAAQPQQHEEYGVLQGFKLLDLSGVNPDRSSEQQPAGEVEYGDTQELFNIAMDRMVAVCGKKWTKRAIGMSAPAEQLQFVWRAARYISLCAKALSKDRTEEAELAQSKANELGKLLHLREVVLAALPADNRGHFSIMERDLKLMGEEAAAWAASEGGKTGGAATSAISLETVQEALEDDAVWEDWLHSVMKLLLDYPINVQLPLDAYGMPDFMDAWAAVLLRMGVDTISAAEFMQVIQDQDVAKGLTDKKDYNAFLVMPDPADKLASLVFKIASGTQALDYITSVALGSNRGFLPNLHAGITAACLTKRLSQRTPLTDFQWSQVQQLAHTLCIRHTNAAKSVTTQLLAGHANPEDKISRLLLALLRLYRCPAANNAPDTAAAAAAAATSTGHASAAAGNAGSGDKLQAALGLVLQEWLCSQMQRYYGKLTAENNSRYYESLMSCMPVAAIFSSTHVGTSAQPDTKRRKTTEAGEPAFDPLQQLSPLETTDASTLATDGPLPAGIRPEWQDTVLQRLLGLHAGNPTHPVLARFVLCAGRLLELLHLPSYGPPSTITPAAVKAGLPTEDCYAIESALPGPAAALDSCWPQWKQAALQAVLLRFRTARYTCKHEEQPTEHNSSTPVAAAAGKPQWEPAQLPNSLCLAVQRLQEAFTQQLKSYKQARQQEAKQQLLQLAANVLRQHAKDPEEAFAALKELQLVLPLSACQDAEQGTADNNSTASAGGPTARLLNVTYTLQRTDVPALLELLGAVCTAQPVQPAAGADSNPDSEPGSKPPQQAKGFSWVVTSTGAVTPGLMRVLALGTWCSQPAQVFRRSMLLQQLCDHFGSECTDVLAAIKQQQVCSRTTGSNRNGHSASLPYPGPDGWTEEYEAARLAAFAGKRVIRNERGRMIKVSEGLRAMQQFTAVAAWARQAAAGDAGMEAAVALVLSQEADAKKWSIVQAKLQALLAPSQDPDILPQA